MNLFQKILFSVAPPLYWILPILGALLKFIEGDFGLSPAYIFFNLFLLLVANKAAILIHELGHLITAKLVGGKPKRLELGRGHELFRTRVGGVKVILNSRLDSGFAFSAFDAKSISRLRLFLYTSGGVLANLLLCALFASATGLSSEFATKIHIPTLLVVANLIIALSAIIPRRIHHHGVMLYSDGLKLLKIPRYNKANLAELIHVDLLLDAHDLMEEKEYESSIQLYEKYEALTNNSKRSYLNLGVAHLKSGNYSKSLQYFENLHPSMEKDGFKNHKNFFYNALAWNHLLLNNLEKANSFSIKAFEIDHDLEYIKGTRGAILILNGEYEDGIELLTENMSFGFKNSLTLMAALFLGLAYFHMEKQSESEKYLIFVNQNKDVLGKDEMDLFHRVIARVGSKEGLV